ncbi:tyrosinase [Blastomyces dermatitidis ER-3]|uniref:Tyrosinase n=1 Tax=Ajellomyces dermatitidis (strain ER-3 / ATCC MYA-2586) TaxID=559297 RepID=A0ABP2EM81_AJEDR|nr:tyrosinase [Blastomyces dermatitidis ER-3]EEQ84436.2 tyrosinase [Blastomyces dermatitidis ER-3]
MKQHVLASLFCFCSILIIGALGGSDTANRKRREFIDSGARLLQLQSKETTTCMRHLEDDEILATMKRREGVTMTTVTVVVIGMMTVGKYVAINSKPSLFTQQEAPGSKNLFDSFAAVHINKTPFIHGTFNFLAWHRYFVWAYEKALREECGYHGASPYWEWGYDVHDPEKSAVFDGSAYSLGSNGAPLADRAPTYRPAPPPPLPQTEGHDFPAGTGGGCVMYGPFSDLTTNLGPVAMPGGDLNNPLRYNPRCLMRDMNALIGQHYTAFNWSTWTIEESKDIDGFQSRLAGLPGNQGSKHDPLNFFGVHGGGHLFLGGMTGQHSDFYSSPQEPAFFLHHGQIDRLWSIWQWLDIKERRDAIYGTLTLANIPPTRNGTLDDIIDVGPLAPPVSVREVMSTIDGPFCYFYE